MQIGDIVKVSPETLNWNPEIESVVGKLENKKITLTQNRMSLQSFKALGYTREQKIRKILKEGFTGEVWSLDEKEVNLSMVRLQTDQYKKIYIGNIYEGVIEVIAEDCIFVNVQGVSVRVFYCECSRARVTELQKIYQEGERLKVKITSKEFYFPYYVGGSIKRAYPTLMDEREKYKIGDEVEVRVCDRLNYDGFWVEVTPGIAGILNVTEEQANQIETGQRLLAQVTQKDLRRGIKCVLAV